MGTVDWLVVAAGTLLIVTKIFDVITTIRHGTPDRETNPLIRPLMQRFGVRAVAWGVWGVLTVIVAITTLGALFAGNLPYRILFISMALLISLVQLAVARFNQTHVPNPVTRFVLALYNWSASLLGGKRH